jgi:hypothetical protein
MPTTYMGIVRPFLFPTGQADMSLWSPCKEFRAQIAGPICFKKHLTAI